MKVTLELESPEQVKATLTATMTIGDWKQFLRALENVTAWPITTFKMAAWEAVNKAETAFEAKVEK